MYFQKTGKELMYCGNALQNCLGTYCSYIVDKGSLIYGIFENNKLLYVLEILDKTIIQISQKRNEAITNQKHLYIIKEWMKQHNLSDNWVV